MQFLESEVATPASTPKPGDLDMGKLKREYYFSVTKRIIDSSDFLFPGKLADESIFKRDNDLVGIVRSLCDLISKCYSQNVIVKVLATHTDLKEYGGLKFSESSDLFKAHDSLGIERNDASKDGWEIDLLIRPAVIAFHEHQKGRDKDYSVWLKGIVWMSGKEHSLVPKENKSAGRKAKRRSRRKRDPTTSTEESSEDTDEVKPAKRSKTRGNKKESTQPQESPSKVDMSYSGVTTGYLSQGLAHPSSPASGKTKPSFNTPIGRSLGLRQAEAAQIMKDAVSKKSKTSHGGSLRGGSESANYCDLTGDDQKASR